MSPPNPRIGLEGKTTLLSGDLRRVEDLVDRSGVADIFDGLLPTGGRVRRLPLRTLFVGIGVVAATNQPLYLTNIYSSLLDLHPGTRRRLGITWLTGEGNDEREEHLTLRQVEHLYTCLADVIDPTSRPTSGLDDEAAAAHDTDEHEGPGGGIEDAVGLAAHQARNDELLQLLCQLIIEASLPEDYTPAGHTAIDATMLRANSRPVHTVRRARLKKALAEAVAAGRATSPEELLANDEALAAELELPTFGDDPVIDRARLSRVIASTRDPADPDAATIVHKGTLIHAYAAHLAVSIPSEADIAARLAHKTDVREAKTEERPVRVPAPAPVPLFTLGLNLTASTAAPAPAAIDLTRRLADGPDLETAGLSDETTAPGQAAQERVESLRLVGDGDTVVDRGYSQAAPEDFHRPMRVLGRRLIFDLNANARGVTGSHRGAVLAFGNLYSPGILDHPELLDGSYPGPFAPKAVWNRYADLAEARAKFRLRTHTAPDADGHQRLGCPALAGRGTLGCPVRGTVGLVITKDRTEVFTPPTGPLPDVCKAKTVDIPPDVLGRTMDIEWASRAWYDSFYRRRPRVEGMNGIIKNPTFSALDHMQFRVRGRAKVTILVAFALAIANLRAADRWNNERARVTQLNAAITAAKKSRSRRRAATIETHLGSSRRRRGRPAPAGAP